ncbi:MAG: LptF/LptG family permease, partial [Epsilonproteobacteria bacterium]|nr:LptF/LptG family permease [Campylobacterota bacterium]
MFKIYFNYLFIKGLKYFLIILFAITISAAFIDLLQNMGKIDGFNLRILYFFYIWEDFLTILYPLAFIFGVTTTLFILIDKNSFIALFSFGYSKDDLFKPFLI